MARLSANTILGLVLLATASTLAHYQFRLDTNLSFTQHWILSQIWLYSAIAGIVYFFSSDIKKVRKHCITFFLNGFSIGVNVQNAFFTGDPSPSIGLVLANYIVNATWGGYVSMVLPVLLASGDLSKVEDPEAEALEDAEKGEKMFDGCEREVGAEEEGLEKGSRDVFANEKVSEKVEVHERCT